MTLTQFIKTNQGKKVDFDGKYGAQCVDLYRAYCRDVLDIQQTPAVAGAKDIITKPGVLEVTRDSALADYSRGDVLVWDATSSNKYGHVAILVAVYNTKYFIVFEQDGFKQDGARLAFRSREGLLGCLWRKGGY
ncbi:MAG: CHAP domain-containing protein [Treponema sp.]|nr:CHAP domain-containing protein [Treponema sp.]MBQ5570189.1 CHAP domain-containing protein [Treponema sp.]